METNNVYVTALQDSLSKKLEVLQQLLELTQEQEEILGQEEPGMDRFEEIIQEKDQLLREVAELDRGFDSVFAKVGNELKENKYQYQQRILQMQNLIRSITDCGLKLEGLEQKNKASFQQYLSRERQEIKNFMVNNRTANTYYQNMANQHHEWQTYFLDQKK